MQNLKNERGQGLVEYIILICLMAVFLFAAVQKVAKKTDTAYTNAENKIAQLPS